MQRIAIDILVLSQRLFHMEETVETVFSVCFGGTGRDVRGLRKFCGSFGVGIWEERDWACVEVSTGQQMIGVYSQPA